jgi:hypothetical protein
VPAEERAVARFAADARLDAAVADRARERWLRQAAADEVDLTGVLDASVRNGETVTVWTEAGRAHWGRVRTRVADAIGLEVEGGRELLVPLTALAAIEVPRLGPDGASLHPAAAPAWGLAELLALRAGGRPEACAWVRGAAQPLTGELVGAGPDVVVLAGARGRSAMRYVRLASVVELLLSVSG